MPEFDKFSAWIACEGKVLPEYQISVDVAARKVTCWIPCELGKKFEVHWKDCGTNVDSAGYIYLDGEVFPGHFLHGYGTVKRSGSRVDELHERPFIFSKPDPSYVEDNDNRNAGTIMLKVKQIVRKEINHVANAPRKLVPKRNGRRSLPACISFGEKTPTTRQYPQTWYFEPHGKKSSSIQFVFRYRTQDFLLEQGIMELQDIPTQEEAQPPLEEPAAIPVATVAEEATGEVEFLDAFEGPFIQQRTPPTSPISAPSIPSPSPSTSSSQSVVVKRSLTRPPSVTLLQPPTVPPIPQLPFPLSRSVSTESSWDPFVHTFTKEDYTRMRRNERRRSR